MKAILFIARVAFILNLMFVLYFLGYMKIFSINHVYYTGFIMSTGFLLPILVNAILFTTIVIRLMSGKGTHGVPPWLIGANFIFYGLEIMFFFFT